MTNYQERTARFEFKVDNSNGCLIGPQGCHYDTEAEAMYYDQIRLCGCSRPAEVHAFLLRCMGASKDDYPNIVDVEKVRREVEANPEIVTEFVMHFLDSRELTEHGSSVYGSWLTERGKQVLEIGPMVEND